MWVVRFRFILYVRPHWGHMTGVSVESLTLLLLATVHLITWLLLNPRNKQDDNVRKMTESL